MIALALLLMVPLLMWASQTLMLRRVGLPIRWRLSSKDAPRSVRNVGRIVTQVALVALILVYPLAIGQPVWNHFAGQYPPGAGPAQAAAGALMAIVILVGLMLVWLSCDRVEIEVRHARRRWLRRLLLLVPSAVFGAVIEECVFRGVLQFDLLNWGLAPGTAVVVAGFVFAAAHYVRSVKRKWTVFGHVALGITLSAAYAATNDLWLPTGIHAGGIFVILGTRPFIRYRGPAWLTGESIFPFAGIPGVIGLSLLTLVLLENFATP